MKHLLVFLILCQLSQLAVSQTSSTVHTGGTGWKRIAYISGENGRGFGTVTLYTRGGDYRPAVTTIHWYHSWSDYGSISTDTDSPASDYWSDVRLTDDGTNAYIEVQFLSAVTSLSLLSDNYGWRTAALYTGTLPNGGGSVRSMSNGGRLNVSNSFKVGFDGNVGIGTANPQAKLAVNGNILAKEVKVKTDISVPDYVFEEDYELPALTEIAAYVKEHRHLPEIPSARDIEKGGLDLAEMSLLLLKKVEELTLHLIERQRMEQELKQQHEVLRADHEQVKELVKQLTMRAGNED